MLRVIVLMLAMLLKRKFQICNIQKLDKNLFTFNLKQLSINLEFNFNITLTRLLWEFGLVGEVAIAFPL